MKVVCLVKQVPVAGAIAFDPETQRLKREGVPLRLNPFDALAVRHAAAIGDDVVALTMGPPQAEGALWECIGLGAHRAVLSIAAPPATAANGTRDGDVETWGGARDLVDEVAEYDKRFGQTGSPTRVLAVRK